MLLRIYTIILRSILFLIRPFFPYLRKKYKRINDGFNDYFGKSFIDYGDEQFYWIHGVSVGEINCATILIDRFRVEGIKNFLITSTCPEGIESASKIDGVKVAYFPIDLPEHYEEIFSHVNIQAIYIMEVDIWPNLVMKASEYNIPVVLVNGRVSPKTFGFYSWIPKTSQKIFNRLKIAFVQTDKDREYLIKLGMNSKKVLVTGNIKFDFNKENKKLSDNDLSKIEFIKSKNKRVIIIGGSTHDGEEKLLIEVINCLVKSGKVDFEEILLILAPRDINRVNSIIKLSDDNSIVARAWNNITEKIPEIVVIDKFGILTEVYEVGNFIFIGGSTGKIGGHSIIEGIIAKKILITGYDMRNFQDITELVMERECGLMSENPQEISEFILKKLEKREVETINKKFDEILLENVGSVDRIATYLKGRWSLFKIK